MFEQFSYELIDHLFSLGNCLFKSFVHLCIFYWFLNETIGLLHFSGTPVLLPDTYVTNFLPGYAFPIHFLRNLLMGISF